MCDEGNQGARRGQPDEQGPLSRAAVWLVTTAGQALRERLEIQLAADTTGLRMEVDAGGRLVARFQVRDVAFEVAFPDDFPRNQPLMRWRPAADQGWLPPVEVVPPADALTAEARAFAFLEVTVPRVVEEVAARKGARASTLPRASEDASEAREVSASPTPAVRRRRARRLDVETVIIEAATEESDDGSDSGG